MAKFNLGVVFNRFFKLLGENFGLFAALGFFGNVLPTMVGSYALASGLSLLPNGWSGRFQGLTADTFWYVSGTSLIVGILALINLSMITETAILRAVGKPVDIGAIFGNAVRNIIPIFLISLLVALMTGGAAILLLIPGIFVALATCVAVPAYIGQSNLGMWGSVQKSFELTKGNRWWLLLIGFVLIVFLLIVGAIIDTVRVLPLLSQSSTDPSVIEAAVNLPYILLDSAFDGLINLLGSIFTVATYVTLRESKERLSPDNAAAVFS